jgi:hypothetical protein
MLIETANRIVHLIVMSIKQHKKLVGGAYVFFLEINPNV